LHKQRYTMVFKEEGIKTYYLQKIEEAETKIKEETENLRRLEAQRNELNSKGTWLQVIAECLLAKFDCCVKSSNCYKNLVLTLEK
jgi:hypothetical protein